MDNTIEIQQVTIGQVKLACPELESRFLEVVQEQERVIMNLLESLDRRRIHRRDSKDLSIYRAKMIGMLDMLDVLSIGHKEYNWIFNL